MTEEVSTFRLYLMRAGYLVNLVLIGLGAWPALVNHTGPWDPVRGAAFSLYAALSTLSVLGIRYPLKMTPLLLVQLFYKVVWLLAVGAPTWPALRGAAREMTAGAVMDLIVIPWPYVFEHYVKKGGDRWRRRTPSISPEGA
jgi:hypothetical protein